VLRPGGVLVISTPQFSSSSWRAMDSIKANHYWTELENHHAFNRERLLPLLQDSGFEVADFTIPNRCKAQMELYAVRKATS
jgi:protein O-GlcNAc transferase